MLLFNNLLHTQSRCKKPCISNTSRFYIDSNAFLSNFALVFRNQLSINCLIHLGNEVILSTIAYFAKQFFSEPLVLCQE